MRRSIDDARSDDLDDDDRPPVTWAIAIADDYDDAEPRVVLTVEEAGRAGTGLVAHLGAERAQRLRAAIRDALREIGVDPDH